MGALSHSPMSATNVGVMSSGCHELVFQNVPSCMALGLLVPLYVDPYRMVGVIVGAGFGALSGDGACARSVATLRVGISPAPLL